MNTIDRDLAQAVKNLSSINEKAVPQAGAMAINRITRRASTRTIRTTSKEVKIKQKILRKRVRITKAKASSPVGYVRLYRNDVPAISIDTARTQIKRKKGVMLVSSAQRGANGRYQKREHSGNTSIRVGRHKFPNAFLQKLKNGKWHIMQRSSDSRYPIKVCKVPIAKPFTASLKRHANQLYRTDMPKELRDAMKHKLRLIIQREA